MSIACGLALLVFTNIAVTLLVGRFCHMDDLERDPLDTSRD